MAEQTTVVTDDTKTTTPTTTTDGKTVLDDSSTTKKDDDSKTKTADTKTNDKTTTKVDEGKPVVPEKYDLKLPKESPLSDDDLAEIAEEAKGLKLSQEDAQKLVERRSADHAKYMTRAQEQLAVTVQGWREGLIKDEEIGGKDGADYEANIARAKLAVNKFGTPALKKALNETGYGNHPEVVRFMARVGKALKEDNFHTDTKHDKGDGDPTQARANKFYGPTKTA